MFRYSIYCTEEQTRKAVGLGVPIKTFSQSFADEYRTSIIYDKYCSIPPIKREDCEDEIYADIPTAEQMNRWLESQGIRLHIFPIYREHDFRVGYKFSCEEIERNMNSNIYDCYKEAILAAIDAALEYLENQKQ